DVTPAGTTKSCAAPVKVSVCDWGAATAVDPALKTTRPPVSSESATSETKRDLRCDMVRIPCSAGEVGPGADRGHDVGVPADRHDTVARVGAGLEGHARRTEARATAAASAVVAVAGVT